MSKKTLSCALLLLLLLAGYIPTVSTFPDPYDPDTLIIDTTGDLLSVDPAWAYDSASCEIVQNVYEPLAFYMVDRRLGPYEAGLLDVFAPRIAQSWLYEDIADYDYDPDGPGPSPPITIRNRFSFEIRVGIPFHPGGDGTNWGTLTTEDVEYSFERAMVQDRDGGSTWMLYKYLLDTYRAPDPTTDPGWGQKIDHAVQRNATHVWFEIVTGFLPENIMQINALVGGVLCKAWAVSLGDFDGNWAAEWEYIWGTWHNPPESIIEYREGYPETKPVGTGPYKFWYWSRSSSWSITKFDAYWGGWPSLVEEDPAGNNRLPDFITTATWYYYSSWPTRRPRFCAGASDMTVVPRSCRDQILGYPGILCYYPFNVSALDAFFFTFDISETSPYVPEFYPPGQFGPNGIPPDIFTDINVRMGFAYAFNYKEWLKSAWLDEGWQPPEALIREIYGNRKPPYAPYDEDDPALLGPPYKYYCDGDKARYHLQLAWGGVDANGNGIIDPINEPGDLEGALWTNGIRFTIPSYNGDIAKLLAAIMLTNAINDLNPLFQLDPPYPVPLASTYLPQMANGEIPIFMFGWSADYPDPLDFVYPFYHSQGMFPTFQRYSNATMDNLIDSPFQTREQYRLIQELAVTDCPSVGLVQPIGRHWQQLWVRGWYYHPLYGGTMTPGIESTAPTTPTFYVYHMWKLVSKLGDCNNDGQVNMLDLGFMAGHWTGAPGTTYNPGADLSGGIGGTVASEWGYVKGIPDGVVDIVDLAILNSAWGDP